MKHQVVGRMSEPSEEMTRQTEIEIQCRKILMDFYASQMGGHSRLLIGFAALLLSLITVRSRLTISSTELSTQVTYISIWAVSSVFWYLLMRYLVYGVLANDVTHVSVTIPEGSCGVHELQSVVRNKAITEKILIIVPVVWYFAYGRQTIEHRLLGILLCCALGLAITGIASLLPI